MCGGSLWRNEPAATAWMALLAFLLTSLGYLIAWPMDSTQGFHAIMTSGLMPMWLLSGAFFPPGGTPKWLAIVIAVNPLTYGVALLRHALYLGSPAATAALPPVTLCLVATVAFAAATLAGASSAARARTAGALP